MKTLKFALLALLLVVLPAFSAPAPSKSEFFETLGGGFSIDKEFFYVRYAVDLKIVKPLPEDAYVIVLFDNPRDRKSPLTKTLNINPGQTTLSVDSDPVRGIKTKTYNVKIEVYTDDSKTKLITKHRQKIKSDINESHLRKLLPKESQFPEHYLSFSSDGREWRTGYQARTQEQIMRELVLSGEKIESWTELVTLTIHFGNHDISRLVKIMQNQLAATSKDFIVKSIKSEPNDILYTWSHKGSGEWPPQREIRRVFKTKKAIYQLSYVVKEVNLNTSNFDKWMEIISTAELK